MQYSPSFYAAGRTHEGVEALHMTGKGRVKGLDGGGAVGQAKFVEGLFGIAARLKGPLS